MTTTPTQRVCFLLPLRPDRIDDYLAAHEDVWPDMLDALRQAGWHNYSLFLRPDDGLVVGYLETPDFEAAQRRMSETEVNAKWQAGMAEFFQHPDAHPDDAMQPLTEYFHLD
ncbi:MAG: L-rhamnose mutarotase [Actinomycetota bacterium]|nr:L-rhamnose mutarotase [Actinomycetota bacterium]